MKKLIRLAAFTGVLAGSLLAPVSAQGSYPACEDLIGRSCVRGDSVVCTWEERYLDGLYCHSGTWE
jgi:hypothetical protein